MRLLFAAMGANNDEQQPLSKAQVAESLYCKNMLQSVTQRAR